MGNRVKIVLAIIAVGIVLAGVWYSGGGGGGVSDSGTAGSSGGVSQSGSSGSGVSNSGTGTTPPTPSTGFSDY